MIFTLSKVFYKKEESLILLRCANAFISHLQNDTMNDELIGDRINLAFNDFSSVHHTLMDSRK